MTAGLGRILAEVTDQQQRTVHAANENSRQAILDDGGTARPVSEERRQEWARAFKPVWEAFSDDVHPRLIDLLTK